MYPIVWYVVLMALCTAYAARTNARWGPPVRTFIDWPQAAFFVGGIVLSALVIAHVDLSELRLASVVFHASGMTMAIMSGLLGWHRSRAWVMCCPSASLGAVAAFIWWPDLFNNLTLVAVSLGMSLMGRSVTRRGFILGYACLVLFDIYAVSFSGLMNAVALRYPGPFPLFLDGDGFTGINRGFGAGDVLFSAIACNRIHSFAGTWRASLFSTACAVGLLVAALTPGQLPLLIVISPLAIVCLLVPKGFLRIG